MATYPASPGTFAQDTASTGFYFAFVAKTDGTDSTYPYYARYELYDNNDNLFSSNNGFVIRWNSTSSKNEINVNDSGYDNNTGDPTHYKVNSGSIQANGTWSEIEDGDTVTLYQNANGTTWGDALSIGSSHVWTSSGSSGPTVTSITQNVIYVPSDTVSVSDFTLTKDTVSYTPTTSNLVLVGPTVAGGTRFYDYTIHPDGSGWYTRTIDSKSYSAFHYDNSWESNAAGPASGRGVNTTAILNVFGSIPSTTVIDFPSSETGWNLEMRTTRHLLYRKTLSGSGNTDIFGIYIKGTANDIKAYLYYRKERDFQVIDSDDADFSIGTQATMTLPPSNAGNTFSVSVNDWIYYTVYGDGYDYGTDHVSAFTAKGCSRNFW